jgi:multidrug resistance efflux pump
MSQPRRIPIPWSLRWQRFCERGLPLVTFVLCVAGTAWLWQRQGAAPATMGEVEAVRVDIMASATGQLIALPTGQWTLFDNVRANEVIARLDDRLVQAGLETARRELEQLRLDVEANSEQFLLDDSERVYDNRRELARLAWTLQERQLDVLDRITLIETDRVEQRRLSIRLEHLEPLLKENAISFLEVNDTRHLLEAATERIEKNQHGLQQAREQLELVQKQIDSYPEPLAPQYQRLLAPLQAAILVQEGAIAELQLQLELLEVRAPFAGAIAAIHAWPGQVIQPGDPIITLAAEQGRYVVAYVRDTERFRPNVGMKIDLRTRHEQPLIYVTHIEHVGPQIELLPPHQLRDPRMMEWGLPVRIAIPATASLRPGELVDVRFVRQ